MIGVVERQVFGAYADSESICREAMRGKTGDNRVPPNRSEIRKRNNISRFYCHPSEIRKRVIISRFYCPPLKSSRGSTSITSTHVGEIAQHAYIHLVLDSTDTVRHTLTLYGTTIVGGLVTHLVV